jgi:AAA+ superfamily predicted ATPase
MPDQHFTEPLNSILDAYRAGHQTLLVSGRSLLDLHINENGELRPLRNTLVRKVREEFGMGSLVFNLALGPRWKWEAFDAPSRRDFESRLEAARIPLQQEVQNTLRGRAAHERAFEFLAAVQQTIERGEEIPPLMIILEFGEDIVPASDDRGSVNDWVLQMNELLALIGGDYLRRRHPFMLLVCGIPERMDRRVVNSLQAVALPQPEREEKRRFIEVLRIMPHLQGAAFEPGLDDDAVANLAARTPNQSLEEAFLESARTRRPITHARIVERKRTDVVALSDGTLTLLDTDRVRGIRLAGRTVERVLELLRTWAIGLKNGDPQTPMNVLLAGAPSTAKTDLALLTAYESQTPTYQLFSPKGPFVGQSELRARQQQRVFKELSPAFGFIDEITEAMPMQRSSQNLDGGATDAVAAEMLNALADASRAGRTLLIATTNCPWRVGSAMASRFLYVPVLSAVEDDYPDILCAIATRLLPKAEWHPETPQIKKAAGVFFRKGASPRIIRSILSSKIATNRNRPPIELLELAAADCAPQHPRDRAGAEYADLYAISVCSDFAMLPWHGCIDDYPIPGYLKGIVSAQVGADEGHIDWDRLSSRLEELRPLVNV